MVVNICIDQFTLINVYFEIISLSTYWGSSSFLIYIYYRGISSIVRRCIEKETGQEFAVKIIDISGEKSDIYEADLTKRDTVREINILKMCKGHDNISKLTVHIHHKMAGCIEYTKQLICKKKINMFYTHMFLFFS